MYIFLHHLLKKTSLFVTELPPDLCKQQAHLWVWFWILHSIHCCIHLPCAITTLFEYHMVMVNFCLSFKTKCMHLSLSGCVHKSAVSKEARRWCWIPWAGVAGGCELTVVGAGNQTGVGRKCIVCSSPLSHLSQLCCHSKSSTKHGGGACACNLSTWEAGAIGTGVQGNLGYLMRPHVKYINNKYIKGILWQVLKLCSLSPPALFFEYESI